MTWPEPPAVGNTGSAASCCHQRGQLLQPSGLWQPKAEMRQRHWHGRTTSRAKEFQTGHWAKSKGLS